MPAKTLHLGTVPFEKLKQLRPSFEGFDVREGWHHTECVKQARDNQKQATKVFRRLANFKEARELVL
jgi:hypothetical protein